MSSDAGAMSGVAKSASAKVNATVFTSRWHGLTFGGTFSPTTATLLTGPTEAILVDALWMKEDVKSLGNLIEDTGKRLTTIYVTHGHADHYFGIGPLSKRFPDARCVALPSVVEYIKDTIELQTRQWEMLFGDTGVVETSTIPEPLDGTELTVDGVCANIIEVGQADIAPASIVHVPDAGVLVAGDAIYNDIHPMLALSSPDEWDKWLETIDVVENLAPTMIVPGHRRPDSDNRDVSTMIKQTRSYIEDFAQAYRDADSPEKLVAAMVAKYPRHGNAWTLEFSAQQAFVNHRS